MSEATRKDRATLIAMGGLVAVGKSSVSRGLAEVLGAVRFETDLVCAEMLHGPDDEAEGEAAHEADWAKSQRPGFEVEVYRELFRRAEERLAAGDAVVLDGCFARAHQRLEARALALARGLDFLFVECRVPAPVSRRRLAERDAASGTGGWQTIFDGLRARWEPVSELASREHVVVCSDGEVQDVLAPVMARLRSPAAKGTARVASSSERRVVTFDCWNTLLEEKNWHVAHRLRVEELRQAAREAGRDVAHEEARRAFDVAWTEHMAQWEKGIATGALEVARRGLAELGLEEAHPALEHLVRAFEEASHTSDVTALAGARETLVALESAGVACALICDTGLTPGRVVRRHLDREGLLFALTLQSFSDEVGAPKPDARTFAAALEPLGIAPERALHVGDLRRTDVAGARALGITSIRIRQSHDDDPSPHPEADHVVDSHADLVELFRQLSVIG